MILSQFWQKGNFAQSSICNFSHVFLGGGGWGGGGDETFPKFAESLAKILAKFQELKISKKTTLHIPLDSACFYEDFCIR